jgi:hypothetical protein
MAFGVGTSATGTGVALESSRANRAQTSTPEIAAARARSQRVSGATRNWWRTEATTRAILHQSRSGVHRTFGRSLRPHRKGLPRPDRWSVAGTGTLVKRAKARELCAAGCRAPTERTVVRRNPARYLVGVVALALVLGGGAQGAATAAGQPHALTPKAGKRVSSLPYFGWTAVGAADHYEFQLAADSGFNSPVLGSDGHFTTRSTRASIEKTLPNGTYWWRVRAITKTGGVGQWSTPRKVVKAWVATPKPLGPSSGAILDYPAPLVLSWSPVAGAATYDVTLATDPKLGSIVGSGPIETAGLSLAPAVSLHLGTYYWAVTPLDAEGNKGVRSKIRSFKWRWKDVPTNLHVRDLVSASDLAPADFGAAAESDLFLPQFTWSPVPGATRYELEINSDASWAAGSRACCDDKILAATFTPTQSFKSNTYYWRVRAFDADGNPGDWSRVGTAQASDAFAKTFDNVCIGELTTNCVPSPGPSLQNLRIEDWSGARVTGGSTSSPVAVWDPVPGASSYEYDVTRYNNNVCDFTWSGNDHWRGTTAVNAWTPLGKGPTPVRPYPDRHPVASDIEAPVPGAHYCVRIRARTAPDESGNPVYGDYSTIANAFTYAGPQSGVVAALGTGDYLTPSQGESRRSMPFFRWRPVIGMKSYWVIVSKDASFTNIIDYAFTQAPVYAPRTNSEDTTYPDETTTYYWAVLPATAANGQGASGDPVNIQHGTFQKQVPPASPAVGLSQTQPVFNWKPVVGAKQYDLEVSADPNFGSTVEKISTVAPSYTAGVTYPAGKKLYWRVRGDDENKIGLSWANGSFEYRLATPNVSGNAKGGDTIPTWHWRPVPGAVSYNLHADLPNGSHRDFTVQTAAFTATEMDGTGIFHWQVRADFPGSGSGTRGPYSTLQSFARTIKPPTGAHSTGGYNSLALLWKPKVAAKEYKVQVSNKPDFSSTVEQSNTDNPVYAPRLSGFAYGKGGVFYWRVAAVDHRGNSGDYTKTRTFRMPRKK